MNRHKPLKLTDLLKEIDFEKIRKRARQFCRNSSLKDAEMVGAIIGALEVWEQTGGRQFQNFHNLLDVLLEKIQLEHT